MSIAVLGPVQVAGREDLPLRDCLVLTVLVVRRGRVVDVDEMTDALWRQRPPPSSRKIVQGAVVRLRRALGPDVIATVGHGYRLDVPVGELDVAWFEHLVGKARVSLDQGFADRATGAVSDALLLWRGSPFAELAEWPPAAAEAVRLVNLWESAQDLYLEAMLYSGRAGEVVEQAQSWAERTPFREGRWSLLARTLYVAGRQAEALACLRSLRMQLRRELGIDPCAEVVGLETAILRQDPSLDIPAAVAPGANCPWPGLFAYQSDDADLFFGRDDEISMCLKRLDAAGALVVAGVSGSGKSSLVRAGLVPRLAGAQVVTPGEHPLGTLDHVAHDEVLVVDQVDEVTTTCLDDDDIEQFFARLANHPAGVVVTVRADHLAALARYDGFTKMLERGLFILQPMTEVGLRRVVEGPAREAGLRLEPGLPELVVRDCGSEPGALPLLSHVLASTWRRVEGNTLTIAAYQSSGGVHEAVATTAEHLYQDLDSDEQDRVRALFHRLVLTGDVAPVRLRVPWLSIPDTGVVERLLAARLLALSDDGHVQIAHEALASHWPRLVGWLEADQDEQRLLRHLSAEAVEWERSGRPLGMLYRGVRLDAALTWLDSHGADITDLERQFLLASSAAAEDEMVRVRRTNRRLRFSLASVVVLLVGAGFAAAVAVGQQREAESAQRAAQRAADISEATRLASLAQEATEPSVAFNLAAEALAIDDSQP